ncbi:asparagine synthetase domain-containing protein 1 [Paraphaeosphaeria sporulosa]|uniref:Asparagine synthetase domain-containing protein 1 n=1 Tax=Paraphaeosphaeria sporulosa TaxID=1460663 RepID=A0A177CRU2_9PLEO|nr:asparagine synthetase domain-containing protein 1 [Paraphaeosphaeria sporulosa]OAG10006.1 asparagine synthetase domain-containing protein 1 [Paraphaeosphaeria sporulosa]
MCGIFFSLCRARCVSPDTGTARLLSNRGPDSFGTHQVRVHADDDVHYEATFVSTVLSLRGTAVAEQPLIDEASGSALCWNGEAWKYAGQPVTGSDSQLVFQNLLQACTASTSGERGLAQDQTIRTLFSIGGPYAFVFYDARNKYLYYGRDCLGRRSLLKKHSSGDELIISSVCDNSTGEDWVEVEADGIRVVDLSQLPAEGPLPTSHIPHCRQCTHVGQLHFNVPFPRMNHTIPTSGFGVRPTLQTVNQLQASLNSSLTLRVQHVREARDLAQGGHQSLDEARVAILFSGGLDCALLARLAHEFIPLEQGIDLLNVAFENPRVHNKLEPNESPYELCPDRITGRASHAELIRVCPGRTWRFVEVNVPYSQTLAHRTEVMALMHPHNTEMDLSISYALYFASRGSGVVRDVQGTTAPYSTPAHVLLSGLGADELFGGYGRHAVAFAREGYEGLLSELSLDFDRIGKRNLGRDDRVISDSGKEVRFPYLDEAFISFVLCLPVTSKCDFAVPQDKDSEYPGTLLEPGKRVLRMLAWHLGMKGVAAEKKRAIQFGSRTAKMETGKTKGTQVLT